MIKDIDRLTNTMMKCLDKHGWVVVMDDAKKAKSSFKNDMILTRTSPNGDRYGLVVQNGKQRLGYTWYRFYRVHSTGFYSICTVYIEKRVELDMQMKLLRLDYNPGIEQLKPMQSNSVIPMEQMAADNGLLVSCFKG